MKKYLIFLWCFSFVNVAAFSQTDNSNTFIFNSAKSDSLNSSYSHHSSNGNSTITLYADSTYEYDVDSVDVTMAEFSCGRWGLESNGMISLQSDSSLFQNIFNRKTRLFTIDKYSFLTFSAREYIIAINQSLQSFSPPVTRSINPE
ncbi:MAG: hypothetical protein JST75_09370 [Bacteroidetes bacterium]|nr:hypothetical protein [Bacteroidota bacterium]